LNLVLALEECRNKAIPSLQIPFFIAHGTCDYGVPIEGSEFLWENAAPTEDDRVFERIEGGYHDLLGDSDAADTVMQLCLDWIKKRLNTKKLKR
jgi:alpha-beta hydrolase superfamily lysophospholipase